MKLAWRIREKLLILSTIMIVIVCVLSYSSFHGASLFRGITKSIRNRASELPLAAKLGERVSDLRITFYRFSLYSQLKKRAGGLLISNNRPTVDGFLDDEISLRQEFLFDLEQVSSVLSEYKAQLDEVASDGQMLSDIDRETTVVKALEGILARVATDFAQTDWLFTTTNRLVLDQELAELQEQVTLLPGFMGQRMGAFHEQARSEYKTWMFLSGMMSLAGIGLLLLMGAGIYFWILRPMRELIRGSRLVANGDFDHRIFVNTNDEVADLAAAMNLMTENFQLVRDDLDEQVRRRTKEAVRSDRLAGVGFLAAGVAHEINNPLASIAWSAESVEKRFDLAFESDESEEEDPDVKFIRKYLRRIQQESFRCKGITERLLDFSRLGESEKRKFNLTRIIQGVIDMVKNLGKYREKKIHFQSEGAIETVVNGQEIKQVVLNLLTNALDCIEPGGNVWVSLQMHMGQVVVRVRDDGCGMPPEVLEHVFEPFYTKRKHGEGTGLGLSISHQIIVDHSGSISATSEGKGMGAEFQVTLPLNQPRSQPIKESIPTTSNLGAANSNKEPDDTKKEKARRIAA